MTLRDLTPRQRYRLLCRGKSRLTYWKMRPPSLGLKDLDDAFCKGYDNGIKATLDILLTPKKDAKGK